MRLFCVSDRTFRCYLVHYESKEIDGLLDKRVGDKTLRWWAR